MNSEVDIFSLCTVIWYKKHTFFNLFALPQIGILQANHDSQGKGYCPQRTQTQKGLSNFRKTRVSTPLLSILVMPFFFPITTAKYLRLSIFKKNNMQPTICRLKVQVCKTSPVWPGKVSQWYPMGTFWQNACGG